METAAATTELYRRVRAATEALCRPLAVEDYVPQSMPDASPVKWHLAHTSWFFETFVLDGTPGHRPLDERYAVLFNSYYQSIGAQHPRPERGLLTRPTVDEVYEYRRHVDRAMERLLADGIGGDRARVVEVGLHHEEQHQELIVTDVKHLFGTSPLRPAYRSPSPAPEPAAGSAPVGWKRVDGGVREVGHAGDGFCFDNETPRHRVLLEPFAIGRALVTCGDWLGFVEDGGYARPAHWLSDGWSARQRLGWEAPLYWRRDEGGAWRVFSLDGERPLEPREPVCHVSYYEADAYARWAGARLPLEEEWEVAVAGAAVEGRFADAARLHPAPPARASSTVGDDLSQPFGEVWQWTASPYRPYPGFRPWSGALGEYNGKFMCNQMVLRGASCATPRRHARATYRNFFPPEARWQMTGLRLARDG